MSDVTGFYSLKTFPVKNLLQLGSSLSIPKLAAFHFKTNKTSDKYIEKRSHLLDGGLISLSGVHIFIHRFLLGFPDYCHHPIFHHLGKNKTKHNDTCKLDMFLLLMVEKDKHLYCTQGYR